MASEMGVVVLDDAASGRLTFISLGRCQRRVSSIASRHCSNVRGCWSGSCRRLFAGREPRRCWTAGAYRAEPKAAREEPYAAFESAIRPGSRRTSVGRPRR